MKSPTLNLSLTDPIRYAVECVPSRSDATASMWPPQANATLLQFQVLGGLHQILTLTHLMFCLMEPSSVYQVGLLSRSANDVYQNAMVQIFLSLTKTRTEYFGDQVRL
jgi:hypothetical protein